MHKLLFTPNTPFDMTDWECRQITEVFAGVNCVMALDENGQTLQKIKNPDLMARTKFWKNITHIALSKCIEGAAIGLVKDGTCMISKRPVRKICADLCLDFDHINSVVKSWTEVVQVEASDAYFALRSDGTVQYVSLSQRDQSEYAAVKGWRDVVRIVAGTQNSIFGITKNGTILSAGFNSMNINKRLSAYSNVVDICPVGSECTNAYVLRGDGSVEELWGTHCNSAINVKTRRLGWHFNYKAVALTDDHCLVDISVPNAPYVFSVDNKIVSFAVGDNNYCEPFVIGVAEL